MEKLLICDICGTSYADAEDKCPTCGYGRAFELENLYSERPAVPHVKVRGGRYSKKNVQKRLQEQAETLAEEPVEEQPAAEQPVEEQPVAEQPVAEKPAAEPVVEEVIVPPIPEELESVPENTMELPDLCLMEDKLEQAEAEEEIIAIELPELEAAGEPETLDDIIVVEFPAEAAEAPVKKKAKPRFDKHKLWLNLALGFASVVFALSALYLVVTYAVPAVKEMLPAADPTVVATEAPTTEPTETEAPTEVEEVLMLNYTALTFTKAEDVTKIFAVGIADREIVWTSDDPAVASVSEAGLVTAVGSGTTTIRAVYGEQEAVVTVTCNF